MRRRRRRKGLLAGCVAVSAVAVVLIAAALFGRGEPGRAPSERAAALRRTDAADRVFSDALPAFAIALDAWSRSGAEPAAADLEAAIAALRAAAGALPAPVSGELAGLVEAARATAAGGDGAALLKAVSATNAALAAANLAYRVEAEVVSGSREVVLLFCFAVDQVVVYRAGERRLRALRASRIDGLGWRYTLLGFTGPHMNEALVLEGRVTERAVALAPALAGRLDALALGAGDQVAREDFWPLLSAAAAAGIAADLGARGSAELGRLVAARAELFDVWGERLAGRGLSLAPPATLELPAGYRDAVAELATADELARLDALGAELAAEASRRAFAELREALALSIERHEMQHLLDRATDLPVPAPLARYVGAGAADPSLRSGDVATVALAELSAYLAELARGDLPHLQLAVLAGYLVEPAMWGSGECYAALVIAAELAEELGLGELALVERRRVQPARAAARFSELMAIDGERLRRAAARRWQTLFGRPLAELERLPPGSGPLGLDR